MVDIRSKEFLWMMLGKVAFVGFRFSCWIGLFLVLDLGLMLDLCCCWGCMGGV